MANIKSFGDLDERSDSDEEPQDGKTNDYYAGGAKSGQVIRGAPDPQDEDEDGDQVKSLFNRAQRMGARQGTSEDIAEASTSSAFQGTGHTLAGGSRPPPAKPAEASGPRKHVITFYRNAIFTVDNGPARSVNDPVNFPFITAISRGECPPELEPTTPNTPIDVSLVRKEEDYKEPEKPKELFVGSGQTLGSNSGACTSAAALAAHAATLSEAEWAGADDSKPTTSIQLRLADGSRAVARLNHTHRISDIRRFIRASRPDLAGPYSFMTAFPTKLIEDESRTLEDAGLLNAVLIQTK